MLVQEASCNGGINVYEEGMNSTEKEPSNKLYALQAIFNAERSGLWSPNFLNQLENVMTKHNKNIHDMNYTLDVEALQQGWQEYEGIWGKEAGNYLEQNPCMMEAGNIIVGYHFAVASTPPGRQMGFENLKKFKIKKNTASGKYSLLGEMPEVEGIKYQKFLQNGSKEVLTKEYKLGLSKVDEAIALKKINYDDIIKLRVKENAYQGGSKTIENAIPNVDKATINPNKLTGYALNPEHPVGGNKAKVFESALGYNQSNADELIQQVYQKLPQNEAVLGTLDQYGQRYTVNMPITGPNGNTVNVRTGWIIKTGSDIPELTTIYVK